MKRKPVSLLNYCQKASFPFIDCLQISFLNVNFEYWTVSTSDFHYEGAPRDTSCCWNRSWEGKHSETPFSLVTSWTLPLFALIICYIFSLWLFLALWFSCCFFFFNILMFWKSIWFHHFYNLYQHYLQKKHSEAVMMAKVVNTLTATGYFLKSQTKE